MDLGDSDDSPALPTHARDVDLAPAHPGKWLRAAEHFLTAASGYERRRCAYQAAQAREQAALALWEAGDARAGETLNAALGAYQHLGASRDADRCARIARTRGVPVAVPYRGGPKGYGVDLSPREREVAQLAAAGYTNRQIGVELWLSPATVDGHLCRAMRKLGVHHRAALAARLLSSA